MSYDRERQHRADQRAGGADGSFADSDRLGKVTLVEAELGSVQRKSTQQRQPGDTGGMTAGGGKDPWKALDGVQFKPGETAAAFRNVIDGIRTVQRARTGNASTPADIEARAASGVSTGGGPVPHAPKMEAAFGTSFAGVTAHTGTEAQAACDSLGAEAYATGNSIAFKTAAPSESLVAHELTHVLQQRAGVQAKGAGESASLEAEADSAGSRVAAGESVADITAKYAGGNPESGAVQRKAAADSSSGTRQDELVATGSGEETPEEQPTAEVPGADVASAFSGPAQPANEQTAAAVSAVTGEDVSGARVHDNPAANRLAASLGTPAVTLGADIAVAEGANINVDGNKILAHELTHVAQQGGAVAAGSAAAGAPAAVPVGAASDAAETEAHMAADLAASDQMNAAEAAVAAAEPKRVPELPSEKLSPLERQHLKATGGKRTLRAWSTENTLSKTLNLWPTNLTVKMKTPPNIVKSSYAGGWQPKVYFNHEWSWGGKGRFSLGGVQHDSWEDGNSWTTLKGVPVGKLALPSDDYTGAKTQAEASMSRRPDFRFDERTVRVGGAVMTYKSAFAKKPSVSATEFGFDESNATHASAEGQTYSTTYSQSVQKSVSETATGTFGSTSTFSNETSVGAKGTKSKGTDDSGKLGLEATLGKKWTETETATAQRALGESYGEVTAQSKSETITLSTPKNVLVVILMVPVTRKITSTFVTRGGLDDDGMINSSGTPNGTHVLEAHVPKGMHAIQGYDVEYYQALQKHFNECKDDYQKAKSLKGKRQRDAKKALAKKIDDFNTNNQQSYARALEHAQEQLRSLAPTGGQKTHGAAGVSVENIETWKKQLAKYHAFASD